MKKVTAPPAIFISKTGILTVLLFACLCHGQSAGVQQSTNSNTPQPSQPQMMSRAEVTGIIAASRKIVSPNGVDELLPLQINGSTQWVSIRGKDRRNPIILFLHGGPGSPTMPADYTFQTPWEDYFTVVQWDQRGTGKTYAANDPNMLASTMTITQMTSDTEEVVQYLLKTFSKRKIFLLGHSWGSVLGLAVAQRHPEWLHAVSRKGAFAPLSPLSIPANAATSNWRGARVYPSFASQPRILPRRQYPSRRCVRADPSLSLSSSNHHSGPKAKFRLL